MGPHKAHLRLPMRDRRGVALLEVIIAALMLGVGLAVTLSTAAQALRSELTGERRLTATWLADEALALVLAQGPRKYMLTEPMEGRFQPPFEEFDWILDLNQPSDWEAWNVSATVSWRNRSGTMSVTIDTRIAPRQGDEDDASNWKPLEMLDREARTWDEDDAQPLEGGGL